MSSCRQGGLESHSWSEVRTVKLQCQVLSVTAFGERASWQFDSVKYCKDQQSPEQSRNVYENKRRVLIDEKPQSLQDASDTLPALDHLFEPSTFDNRHVTVGGDIVQFLHDSGRPANFHAIYSFVGTQTEMRRPGTR